MLDELTRWDCSLVRFSQWDQLVLDAVSGDEKAAMLCGSIQHAINHLDSCRRHSAGAPCLTCAKVRLWHRQIAAAFFILQNHAAVRDDDPAIFVLPICRRCEKRPDLREKIVSALADSGHFLPLNANLHHEIGHA